MKAGDTCPRPYCGGKLLQEYEDLKCMLCGRVFNLQPGFDDGGSREAATKYEERLTCKVCGTAKVPAGIGSMYLCPTCGKKRKYNFRKGDSITIAPREITGATKGFTQ